MVCPGVRFISVVIALFCRAAVVSDRFGLKAHRATTIAISTPRPISALSGLARWCYSNFSIRDWVSLLNEATVSGSFLK